MAERPRRPAVSVPTALLWLLIAAYAVFFSAYASQRHAALQSYAADLSYFDQPMWNTLHGRFMQRTLEDRQVPRMTDHFEPILVPLSAVYLLWDDVRAILVVQALALALGALPVYWIARRALARTRHPLPPRSEWLALAFAVAYLLFPAGQAANLADFHADPLLVTPLLFAFWYASIRRFGLMWLWAIVALAVKENLPSMTFMLGLFLFLGDRGWWRALRHRREARARGGAPDLRALPEPADRGGPAVALRRPWVHGAALMVVSLAWLGIAMFAIVGPTARQFYGTAGPVYLSSRFGEPAAGGVIELLRALAARLSEPARLVYLAGLFASVGWLALLAPEYLLLGLPVLLANMLSAYPGQYSGEQHYSAPLVPAFMLAAIFGAGRLLSWGGRLAAGRAPRWGSAALALAVGVWLLVWSAGYHVQHGWTPFGRNFAWPQVTAHDRLLARFADAIPRDAAVATTPPLHPHLAHREKIYQFPIVADADYVLVDVSGVTDMHPNDVLGAVTGLLDSGHFTVADAADGYVLLSRQPAGAGGRPALPDAFYDFARARGRSPGQPLAVRFGESLRLLGYDLEDDPKWRQTRYRFYWGTDGTLPDALDISIQMLTPWGAVADDTAHRPMPALLWYPPARWRPGETVVTETVPWYLPRAWAPAIRVSQAGQVLPPTIEGLAPGAAVSLDGERLVLQAMERRAGRVAPLEEGWQEVAARSECFAGAGWSVRLMGDVVPERAAPGRVLPVVLLWQADGPSPPEQDYTVFLHLRDASGTTLLYGDGTPTWFTPWPTSRWPAGSSTVRDAHALRLPPDMPHGRYDLVIGWYDWRTGARLARADAQGNVAGDELVLASVMVDAAAAPVPDLCCLYAGECCESQ